MMDSVVCLHAAPAVSKILLTDTCLWRNVPLS